MTRFRVVRHPLVARDISRIASFLLEHTTPRSVAEKLSVLDEDASSLAENPYRGTRRDEIAPGLRAIPSAGKGVIAFEVREDTHTVRILSIAWGEFNWLRRVVDRARHQDRPG